MKRVVHTYGGGPDWEVAHGDNIVVMFPQASIAGVMLRPKEARRLAKILKHQAKSAEKINAE